MRQTQETLLESIAETIAQPVAPTSTAIFPLNIALKDAIQMIERELPPGFFAVISRDTPDVVVMNSSGDDSTPERLKGTGNGNGNPSIPKQVLRAWGAFNPIDTTRNMNTGSGVAALTAFDTSPSRLFEQEMIEIDLGGHIPTNRFPALFNGKATYSCMTLRSVICLAEHDRDVVIRPTTPQQRQGEWYETAAGIIANPQWFVVLNLKALDPPIPQMSVVMLIWEGDGPVAGVEVYLGRQLSAQLQAQNAQLADGNILAQATGLGPMNPPMGQNGNAGMPSNLPATFQKHMWLGGANVNSSGPANPLYGGYYAPPNKPQPRLPSSTVDRGQLVDDSDFGSVQSPRISLFSEPPCSATTISSHDPTFAPVDTMAELPTGLKGDVFAGFDPEGSDSRDNGPAHETIDPAILSM